MHNDRTTLNRIIGTLRFRGLKMAEKHLNSKKIDFQNLDVWLGTVSAGEGLYSLVYPAF